MSADQQRLNSAIQQIAERGPRVRALLKANDNKGGKPGAAGVGVSEAEESRLCCDGSTSDNANPGTTELDPDADGAGQDGGLNSDDPALLDTGAGTLSGVTDCATGEPICFSGSGFIPPDGWDAPNDPPADDTWREGFYVTWSISVSSAVRASGSGPSTGSEEAAFRAAMETYCLEENLANTTISPCISGGTITSGFAGTGACLPGDSGETRNYSYTFSCNSCSGQPECDYTEADPPTLSEWPGDGCTNLAIVNGSIVGSKYDPENDGSYSAPVQEKEVCDATTGDRILLRVDTNSTYKSIKSLSGDIDPDTQAGYLYETATGRRIRQISPSEFRDTTV